MDGGPVMGVARSGSRKLRDVSPPRGIGLGQGVRGGEAWSGNPFEGMSGVADQMQASSQRFRDVASTQGLAAAMRDPVHEKLATDVAGAFDFTGGIGLGAGVIRAYHGSPHTFDKFDMSKLGTGEGAQAYGHGLYFAENPKVAGDYRDKLSGPQTNISIDGKRSYPGDIVGELMKDLNEKPLPSDPVYKIKENTAFYRGLMDAVYDFADGKDARQVQNLAEDLGQDFSDGYEAGLAGLAERKAAPAREGALYTVDLDVNHDDLLDWDAPLSQQPEKVRKALEGLGVSEPEPGAIPGRVNTSYTITGRDAYENLGVGDREAAARALRAAGIPGIRYLDGGSRAAGDGSRNVVLFDDGLAQIRERNGQPVGIGLGQ